MPDSPDDPASDQPASEPTDDTPDEPAATPPVAPSRLGRITKLVAVTLAVVLLAYVALAAWAVLGLRRYPGWVSAGQSPSGAAMNILLIGTDAAPGQPGRADTLVVVHLPADRSAVYLVSLPRLAQASLRQGVVQLKTARLIGGVPLTVEAVQQVTGLVMDHVVETDFEGFAGLSNVVGGVTVNNRHASRADGGQAMPAGALTLQGSATLAFVRDHSVPDDVRNERQRAVLKAVLAKLPAALANPLGLARLSTDFMQHVSADDGILAAGSDVIARVVSGRDRIVTIEAPLLPRKNDWDRARLDPVKMAALATAMRDGRMASYRPDQP